MYNALGVGAALVHEMIVGLPPPAAETKEHAVSTSPRKGSSGSRGDRADRGHGHRSSSSSPSKGGGKASGKAALLGGRERWVRWGQVGAALLLVGYHGSMRTAERRAERSLEMRTCRRLRDAMDVDAPMMATLRAKLADARSTASADAGTILSAWSFAVEHWQQAAAQKTSQTPIHNMSHTDPEVTRQVVAQALGRSELADDTSEADVVAEVYNLLGIGRLVVSSESVPYFMAAVHAFREQRTRTVHRCPTRHSQPATPIRHAAPSPPSPCPLTTLSSLRDRHNGHLCRTFSESMACLALFAAVVRIPLA